MERKVLQLEPASVCAAGDTLIVDTGKMQRIWRWTGKGLVTVGLRNQVSGKEWVTQKPAYSCDWSLAGLIDETTKADFISIDTNLSTDEGFTSEHIEVVATIEYPETKLLVQYVIWVYPDSPGIRTQIRVKGTEGFLPVRPDSESRVEYIPLVFGGATRREIGYYNDTQHRNKMEMDILREEVTETPLTGTEEHTWGSALCVEDGAEGLALVKESHKCVNQHGINCGIFRCNVLNGIESTGWGLLPNEILIDQFRNCWATWCLVYHGGGDERELAFKVFDRLRYPIDPTRDIYIIANTWGSENHRNAAREENVLREIDSQADLGIDVQQIDAGWEGNDWRPNKKIYPEGWTNVTARAEEKGVKLGLWFGLSALEPKILLEHLKYNYDHGGFLHYKLDHIHFKTYDEIETLMSTVREFIKYTGHAARINWDVTENSPRVGYFFGKEYGCIYLENRKPATPENAVYIPHLILRDLWQISKYTNLNKFQCTVQNIDRVNPNASDAHLHSHQYCVAIALMGTPIFFQETHLYSDIAREQVRSLLRIYKKHRDQIYEGYVFPIGEKPNNQNWTGFQCHIFKKNAGYLLIFRELNNREASRMIRLKFLASTTIRLVNLLQETESTIQVADDGWAHFKIEKPADFRFYRYEVQ